MQHGLHLDMFLLQVDSTLCGVNYYCVVRKCCAAHANQSQTSNGTPPKSKMYTVQTELDSNLYAVAVAIIGSCNGRFVLLEVFETLSRPLQTGHQQSLPG